MKEISKEYRYRVVEGTVKDDFEFDMSQYLTFGWDLQGGLIIDRSRSVVVYSQVIVKAFHQDD